MKEQFIQLLQDTHRQGIDNVINYLEKANFFQAPASVKRHLARPGGLMEHSMNVCRMALALREKAIELRPELEQKLPKDSVVICALLHDLCKATLYTTVKKWRKDEFNHWEEYEAYDTDYSLFPVGHGEKSVINLLRLGLVLNNDEILAIRWHMGPWDMPFQSYDIKQNYSEANNRFALVSLIHSADNLATFLLESDEVIK